MAIKVLPEDLNAHLQTLTPSQLEAFRDKLDPTLFEQLYVSGLPTHAQALSLSDPQWGLLVAGLTKLVILAFVLERSLAAIFEHPFFESIERVILLRPRVDKVTGTPVPGSEGEDHPLRQKYRRSVKAFVAIGAAWALCATFDFNLLAGLFPTSTHSYWGIVLTALIVAGGSQGAITLMQSVLGIRGSTRKALQEAKELEAAARKAQAQAELAKAKRNLDQQGPSVLRQKIEGLLNSANKTIDDLAAHIGNRPTTKAYLIAQLDGGKPPQELKDKIAEFVGKSATEIFG